MENPTLFTLQDQRLHTVALEQGADGTASASTLQTRLRAMERAGNTTWWEYDLVSQTLVLGEQASSILGWAGPAADVTLECLVADVVSAERDSVRKRFTDLARFVNDAPFLFHVIGQNGVPKTLRLEETGQRRISTDNGHPTALGTLTDVSTLANLEHRVSAGPKRGNERFLLESAERLAGLGTWCLDLDSRDLTVSRHLADMIGLPAKARLTVAETGSLGAVHPDDRNKLRVAQKRSMEMGQPLSLEYRLRHYGRRKWITVRSHGYMVKGEHGEAGKFLGVTQDISAQRADEERLRQAAMAFEYSRNMVFVADASGRIKQANRVFYETSGYMPEEVENTGLGICSVLYLSAEVRESMERGIATSGAWRGEVQAYGKGGMGFTLVLAAATVCDGSGAVASQVYVGIDISAERAADEQIRRLAFYDALTGLPNRMLIRERAETAIRQSRRQRDETAILYLDLDHFKHVNDSLGHAAGDELLREVSRRLQSVVRLSDSVARLSGDEFLIVLPGADSVAAAMVADKVVQSICAPIKINGSAAVVGTSIGIGLYPRDADNYEELLRMADIAMYRAKEGGRNGYRFYTNEMGSEAQRRIGLTNDLRQALVREQLEIHYQPILQLEGQTAAGVEALLRWRHPQRGLISPMEFIPLAEEAGIIEEIGAWVIGEACRQNVAWQRDRGVTLTVSVNCSSRQLRAPEKLAGVVREVLAESGMPAERLELEITESMMLDETERIIKVLNELRELGVKIAIDDFGTGYSNLSQLKRMPIDKLKIDRSFVCDIATNDGDRAIAATVATLARTLGLTVIAEGVENAGQLELLASMGYDQAQGFLWSEPLPVASLLDWLQQPR